MAVSGSGECVVVCGRSGRGTVAVSSPQPLLMWLWTAHIGNSGLNSAPRGYEFGPKTSPMGRSCVRVQPSDLQKLGRFLHWIPHPPQRTVCSLVSPAPDRLPPATFSCGPPSADTGPRFLGSGLWVPSITEPHSSGLTRPPELTPTLSTICPVDRCQITRNPEGSRTQSGPGLALTVRAQFLYLHAKLREGTHAENRPPAQLLGSLRTLREPRLREDPRYLDGKTGSEKGLDRQRPGKSQPEPRPSSQVPHSR